MGLWLASKGFNPFIAGDDFNAVENGVAECVNGTRGLFLTGACGCGKTHLMKTIYEHGKSHRQKYWIDCGDPNSVWLLDINKNSKVGELYDFNLFIDDLGTEVKVEYGRRTDFVAEFIRQYHTRGHGKLFITTNLCGKQMLELYDERIVDRIMQLCVVVKFNGESKRERVVVK